MKRELHIAILHTGWIRHELSKWLLWIALNERRMPISIQHYGGDPDGVPCSSNRNRIRRDRPEGSDLIMIDSDVFPPLNLVDIALLGLDVVICPTPIWRSNRPGNPVITNAKMLDGTEQLLAVGTEVVVEVEAGGASTIYIANWVLDHPRMRGAFQFVYDDDGVMVRTEDHEFCRRARENGFKVHMALGYPCSHYKEVDLVAIFDAINAGRDDNEPI